MVQIISSDACARPSPSVGKVTGHVFGHRLTLKTTPFGQKMDHSPAGPRTVFIFPQSYRQRSNTI